MLLHRFSKVATWIVVFCISCPLSNKTKLKFDKNFKAWCWSFCFEVKVVKKSKSTMPCVSCAFDNVLCQSLISLLSQVLTLSLTNISHESCSHTSLRYLCVQKWIFNDGIYFTSGSASFAHERIFPAHILMKSTVDCRIMMQFCLNRNSAGVAELLGNERGLKVKRLRPQSNFVTESIVLFYN